MTKSSVKKGFIVTDNKRLLNLQVNDLVSCYKNNEPYQDLIVFTSLDYCEINNHYKEKEQKIFEVEAFDFTKETNSRFKTSSYCIVGEVDVFADDHFAVNENGLLLARDGFYGSVRGRMLFEYDKEEKPIRDTLETEIRGKDVTIINNYFYNESGLLSSYDYRADGLKSKFNYWEEDGLFVMEEVSSMRFFKNIKRFKSISYWEDKWRGNKKIKREIFDLKNSQWTLRETINANFDKDGYWIGYEIPERDTKIIKIPKEDGSGYDLYRIRKNLTSVIEAVHNF